MSIEVRPVVVGSADHLAVQRLRYSVYAEEESFQLEGMDHVRRTFEDASDAGARTVAAFDGDVAVGTIRLTPLSAIPQSDPDRQALEQLAVPVASHRQGVIGRLMVRSTHRGTATTAAVFAAAYRLALEIGFEFGFLDCSPRHVPLYESVGCRVVGAPFGHEEFGLLLPMGFVFRDLAHMRRISSPLLLLAEDAEPNHELAAWFNERCGANASPRSLKMMLPPDQTRIASTLASMQVPLLDGLSSDECRAILRTASVFKVAAGAQLLPMGSKGTEAYIVLDGRVSLRSSELSVTGISVGPGENFAEGGCLGLAPESWTWDAIAQEDSSLLAISAETLRSLGNSRPQLFANLQERLLVSRTRRVAGWAATALDAARTKVAA